MKEFLDDAVEGVVYFSLGSNVKSAFLDENKRNVILETLSQLPYKILWKFETEDITEISPNIKILEWIPQQAVLAHPNLKLFISQGGLQSMEEAIVYKVPLLVIPFIFDQQYNAKRAVQLGIGLSLSFEDMEHENLKEAIIELTTNPRLVSIFEVF